jgi:hypothetical protein
MMSKIIRAIAATTIVLPMLALAIVLAHSTTVLTPTSPDKEASQAETGRQREHLTKRRVFTKKEIDAPYGEE